VTYIRAPFVAVVFLAVMEALAYGLSEASGLGHPWALLIAGWVAGVGALVYLARRQR
jgi:hypothetical protein